MREIGWVMFCLAFIEGCAGTGAAANCPAAAPAPPIQTDALSAEPGVAAIAKDVSGALANIMSPETIPPAWANRVGSPSDAFMAKWASLMPGGHAEVVTTLLDIGAVTTKPGNRAEVQAKLIVMSDGRVRYSTIAAREGASVDANPTPGLAMAEPAVAALVTELMNRLKSGPCQVPFLSGEELLTLPATLHGELGADLPSVAMTCAIVRRHPDASWGPVLEAAVVILRRPTSYVAVAAHFHMDTQSGKVVLQPIDVAPVTGPTMELAWSGEPGAAAPSSAGKPAASAAPPPAATGPQPVRK